jgi:hypothetical protein
MNPRYAARLPEVNHWPGIARRRVPIAILSAIGAAWGAGRF